MKHISLPITDGGEVTLFINGPISVYSSMKRPNECRVQDGNHNNGGWPIALSRQEVVKRIAALFPG